MPSPYLVLDIGGGSTEFVMGREPGDAEHAISTQMGSVRLTERFFRSDPPDRRELSALELAVADVLDEVESHVPVGGARTLVAVAGTATTLQAIALGLDVTTRRRSTGRGCRSRRPNGCWRLAGMTPRARGAPRDGPRPGRRDRGGGCDPARVMRRFGFERALVSETDILDGLAFEMLDIR